MQARAVNPPRMSSTLTYHPKRQIKDKIMFRDTDGTEINEKYFSVGSVVIAGHNKYLVVGEGKYVRLLCLKTFKVLKGGRDVEDPNFLSATEARELISNTAGDLLQYTFSDFDLDPRGLKYEKAQRI